MIDATAKFGQVGFFKYSRYDDNEVINIHNVDPSLKDVYQAAVEKYNSWDAGHLTFVDNLDGTYMITCTGADTDKINNALFSATLCDEIVDQASTLKGKAALLAKAIVDRQNDLDDSDFADSLAEQAEAVGLEFYDVPAMYAFQDFPMVGSYADYTGDDIDKKIAFAKSLTEKDSGLAIMINSYTDADKQTVTEDEEQVDTEEAVESVEDEIEAETEDDIEDVTADAEEDSAKEEDVGEIKFPEATAQVRPLVSNPRISMEPNKYTNRARFVNIFDKATNTERAKTLKSKMISFPTHDELLASVKPKFEALKNKAITFGQFVALTTSAGWAMMKDRHRANKVADARRFLEGEGYVTSLKESLEDNAINGAEQTKDVTGKGREVADSYAKATVVAGNPSFGALPEAKAASTLKEKAKRHMFDIGLGFKASYYTAMAQVSDYLQAKKEAADSYVYQRRGNMVQPEVKTEQDLAQTDKDSVVADIKHNLQDAKTKGIYEDLKALQAYLTEAVAMMEDGQTVDYAHVTQDIANGVADIRSKLTEQSVATVKEMESDDHGVVTVDDVAVKNQDSQPKTEDMTTEQIYQQRMAELAAENIPTEQSAEQTTTIDELS